METLAESHSPTNLAPVEESVGGWRQAWAHSIVSILKPLEKDQATSEGGRVGDRWRQTSRSLGLFKTFLQF